MVASQRSGLRSSSRNGGSKNHAQQKKQSVSTEHPSQSNVAPGGSDTGQPHMRREQLDDRDERQRSGLRNRAAHEPDVSLPTLDRQLANTTQYRRPYTPHQTGGQESHKQQPQQSSQPFAPLRIWNDQPKPKKPRRKPQPKNGDFFARDLEERAPRKAAAAHAIPSMSRRSFENRSTCYL